MVLLTKAQRHALCQLFRRAFPSWVTPFKRQNGTRFFTTTHAWTRSFPGLGSFLQQGRPRLWHDRLETQFFRRLVCGLDSFLPDSGSLRPLRFRLARAGRRGFSDPRSFLPFQNRGVCSICEAVCRTDTGSRRSRRVWLGVLRRGAKAPRLFRKVCLGRLPILSGRQLSNPREACINHEPRPSKVRFRLGYIDHFIK
jgi:hypothetical protein